MQNLRDRKLRIFHTIGNFGKMRKLLLFTFSQLFVYIFQERPPLRKFLMDGDFFIGAALAATLTKLSLHFTEAVLKSDPKGQIKANRFLGEAMLVLASVLHLGQSGLPTKAITNDDADRISLCLKVLAEASPDNIKGKNWKFEYQVKVTECH